jgi:hypothetical protein
MIGRVFTAASALSLLLCVGAVVLWARSYRISDSCSRKHVFGTAENDVCSTNTYQQLLFSTSNGRLWVEWRGYALLSGATESPYLPGRPIEWVFEHQQPGTYWWVEPKEAPGWHGFFYSSTKRIVPASPIQNLERTVLLPISWLSWLFAILPAAWIIFAAIRYLRARTGPHACATCGYDLRASADRCPECGALIPPNAEPTA